MKDFVVGAIWSIASSLIIGIIAFSICLHNATVESFQHKMEDEWSAISNQTWSAWNQEFQKSTNVLSEKDKQIMVLRQEMTNLAFTPRNSVVSLSKPWATPSELSQEIISNRTVYVPDLPCTKSYSQDVTGAFYGVLGKTFRYCDLVGPAVIYMQGSTLLDYCTMDYSYGPQDIRAHLFLNQSHQMAGVIAMSHCVLEHCSLIDLSFTGDALDIEYLRRKLEQAPTK